jgi:1,4-dihydroxy-2-naphthoate octaprenyltransferase
MPRHRAWLLAVRPKTLTAAAAPVFLGSGLAASHDAFRWLPALAALTGAFLIQIGTNLANDYYDFLRGGDTDQRIGPVRVTQAGIIRPSTVRNAAFFVLGLALLVGVYLVWVGGWPIVIIGLASLVCAVIYTGGPFPLAYHGLGDLFVFVFFGLVAVGGTYWVQALSLGMDVLLAGAGMGTLATAILVVNNLRDIRTDAVAGKRTLAVRLGVGGTRVEFFFLVFFALSVPPLGVAFYGWPALTVLAVVVAGLPIVGPMGRIRAFKEDGDPRTLIPALAGTALSAGLYGVVLGIALAFG